MKSTKFTDRLQAPHQRHRSHQEDPQPAAGNGRRRPKPGPHTREDARPSATGTSLHPHGDLSPYRVRQLPGCNGSERCPQDPEANVPKKGTSQCTLKSPGFP